MSQENPFASVVAAFALAYIDLALELHDRAALDKDSLAERLRKTAARKDFPDDAITSAFLQHIATGLDVAEKEATP